MSHRCQTVVKKHRCQHADVDTGDTGDAGQRLVAAVPANGSLGACGAGVDIGVKLASTPVKTSDAGNAGPTPFTKPFATITPTLAGLLVSPRCRPWCLVLLCIATSAGCDLVLP